MRCSFWGFASIVLLVLLNLGGSCSSHHKDHPNRIPPLADLVREGHDKLKWTADMNGMIYVYDSDKNEVRYEGDVRRGEEVVISPEHDKIYVAERVVYEQNLEKKSWHKLYFISEGNYERSAK